MKTCSRCKIALDESQFYPRYSSQKGLQSECKKCCTSRHRNQYKPNPERNRRHNLKAFYGITQEQYLVMQTNQNNRCLICKKEPELVKSKSTKLYIDHCHKSKKIRGLLCHKCNTAIGLFEEDSRILQSAIEYINKHKE